MNRLDDLGFLEDLLDAEHPGVARLIFVGSSTCPPCNGLRPVYERLSRHRHIKVEFYDLDVDTCEDPVLDGQLTAIFKDIDLRYIPSQILIWPDGTWRVMRVFDPRKIKRYLGKLRCQLAV